MFATNISVPLAGVVSREAQRSLINNARCLVQHVAAISNAVNLDIKMTADIHLNQ